MGDILSEGEILELMAKAESGEHFETTDLQVQRIITSYDFKHPARVNRDQMRTLENLHDNFARLLSSTLSGAMRAVVDVDRAPIDQKTYAEFIHSLSNPCSSYQFILGPTCGHAIIDITMPLAFAFVDRAFGGRGSSESVDARQLTRVEFAVLARILKRMVADLEATWAPIVPVEISDIELETNKEFIQISPPSEIVISLSFEVKSSYASGNVSLCYPFFTLESLLPRLGQQTYVRLNRTSREEQIRQNDARLHTAEVPLRVELGRRALSIEEARQVEVGDLLPLDTRAEESVPIYVGDEPKFLGLPFGEPGNRLKVKISEVLDAAKAAAIKRRGA